MTLVAESGADSQEMCFLSQPIVTMSANTRKFKVTVFGGGRSVSAGFSSL